MNSCNRCGGSLISGEDGLSCLSCGASFGIPEHKPKKRPHGQYSKSLALVNKAIVLYHSGLGYDPISAKLGIAKNTVRKILRNNLDMIDNSIVAKNRKSLHRSYMTIEER
jgi:hypothetical protein